MRRRVLFQGTPQTSRPSPFPPVAHIIGALVRTRWRRREERDRLLHLCTSTFRTGMLFFTLGITPHPLESLAALRAVELVDGHGAHPPGTSPFGCLQLTVDLLSAGVNPSWVLGAPLSRADGPPGG